MNEKINLTSQPVTKFFSYHKDGSGRTETCDCVECMKDFDPLPEDFIR